MPRRLDVALPDWVAHAIARNAAAHDGKVLRQSAAALSASYRAKGRVEPGAVDPWAYVATRAPATYAAIMSALSTLVDAAPDFAPRSLLDAGAGPGTASWAAFAAYPGITQATLIEASPPMRAAGMALASGAPPALANATWSLADLRNAAIPQSDLGLAAYVMNELEVGAATETVRHLFAAAQVLVLVEPGSRAGFERLRAARAALVADGAALVAPCTHALACPIAGDDWCHFSVRVPRSRLHRQIKSAQLAYEDEKFSYLIAAKPALAASIKRPHARIIRHPVARSGHVHLDLCADGAISRHTATRSDGAWRTARKAAWGDGWNPD